VEISAALAADLALLSQALEDPGVDLEAGLRAFTVTVKRAVSSYTGMTMTITLDGHDISFTVHDDTTPRPASRPAASLLVPLAGPTPTDADSTLLLYAATPGAFVDLAADLSYALGIGLTDLILDAHLDPPADDVGVDGLAHHRAINQAIGVLIGRGHTPEAARHELHRLAALDHGDLRAAADSVVRSARAEPRDRA
jgi:hypothetical protein